MMSNMNLFVPLATLTLLPNLYIVRTTDKAFILCLILFKTAIHFTATSIMLILSKYTCMCSQGQGSHNMLLHHWNIDLTKQRTSQCCYNNRAFASSHTMTNYNLRPSVQILDLVNGETFQDRVQSQVRTFLTFSSHRQYNARKIMFYVQQNQRKKLCSIDT